MSSNEAACREEAPDFEALFEEFYPAVLRLFQRWGFPISVAEELTQETFLKVHLGLSRYRGDAAPRTWIWSIAANVYRNELRRSQAGRRSGKEVPLEKPVGDGDEPATELRREVSVPARQEEELAARQDLKLVNGAVGDLPPRMREVFRLRMVDDLKYDAIAEQTNVSVQTVKSQVHQARRRLLSKLNERT